ncbi:MAG: hypothetical protein ABI434_02260 [Burkholderiaceae bacterium]
MARSRKTPGETSSFLCGRDDTVATTVRFELGEKVNLLLGGRG